MDPNILLSKIVASPTESTWAQVYSTLNLYIALSISAEDAKEGIVGAGKELLERIQREYFSLDEKNLKNVKESIDKATSEITDKKQISVVLTTIKDDVLYIVIAGSGSVVLKRNGKLGVIGTGDENETAAFSGKIIDNDIIILETGDFAKKVSVTKLTETLDHLEVDDISENLAPFLHEESTGGEAAIILHYKSGATKEDDVIPEVSTPEKKEDLNEEPSEENVQDEEEANPARKPFKIPGISLPKNLFKIDTKRIVILLIIVFVIILAGSIMVDRTRQESSKRQAVLAEILTPAQKKYDEADALINLNKGLALDEFTQLKSSLDGSQNQIKEGTPERKKLDDFIGRVEGKIGELGAGATLSNQKVIFDKGTDLVEFKGTQLITVKSSTGELNLLSTDGTSQKTYQTKNTNAKAITQDDGSVYVFGDLGVTKTDKSAGKTTTPIKDISNTTSIDTFGSNLYGLNTKTKTIDKYVGDTTPRSDYFKDSITLNNPVSMSIEGSIFIIDNGKIRRFTKGAETTFTVSGLTKELSSDSQIYTDTGDTNVYALDHAATRIVAIAKDSGTVANQYVSGNLTSATSFAVDEKNKKIFVVISGKLYSFDL